MSDTPTNEPSEAKAGQSSVADRLRELIRHEMFEHFVDQEGCDQYVYYVGQGSNIQEVYVSPDWAEAAINDVADLFTTELATIRSEIEAAKSNKFIAPAYGVDIDAIQSILERHRVKS